MNLQLWKRQKVEVPVAEPRPLTGIEKWEMEQERERRYAQAKAESEAVTQMQARAIQLRKELGDKLVELERLENQIRPMLYYPMLAQQQNAARYGYGSFLGALMGGLDPFTALGDSGRRTS